MLPPLHIVAKAMIAPFNPIPRWVPEWPYCCKEWGNTLPTMERVNLQDRCQAGTSGRPLPGHAASDPLAHAQPGH